MDQLYNKVLYVTRKPDVYKININLMCALLCLKFRLSTQKIYLHYLPNFTASFSNTRKLLLKPCKQLHLNLLIYKLLT